ncbi:MAG: hypothetical protein Q8O47_06060 [Candidatus Bathyarchaeota archaeon]|nr:hypothetical protein [Candidatus Bathyarchaeota archaeon]
MGLMPRQREPRSITFFLPRRSVRYPPGSWKTSWKNISAVKMRPTRVTEAPRFCM